MATGDDKERGPMLPPPAEPGKPVRVPTPRIPFVPRASKNPSDVPPRPSQRFTLAEWFKASIPPVPMPIKRVVPRIRQSLLPFERAYRRRVEPWVPRWRGLTPAQTLLGAFGFGAFMFVLVLVTPKSIKSYLYARAAAIVRPLNPFSEGTETAPSVNDDDRADAKMERKGRSTAMGAVLTVPPSFSSADGQYDVVLHFHGNTDLVEESFAVAKLNAVVLIMNLGIGSGPYEEKYAQPDALKYTLERVDEAMVRRGLRSPKRRRLALTAWSAGYGAVGRILENDANAESVDAVLLLDGIHASFLPDGSLDPLRIGPYARFARKAVAGERLFVITHSEIKPPDYPGTHATTDSVLSLVGVERKEGGTAPEFPPLESLHGVPKSKIVDLKPLTEAHAGNFHVQGYAGEGPEDHIAHLVQMASTALPYLAKRWGEPGDAAPAGQ